MRVVFKLSKELNELSELSKEIGDLKREIFSHTSKVLLLKEKLTMAIKRRIFLTKWIENNEQKSKIE